MKKTNEAGVWIADDGRYYVRTTAKCPRTGTIRQKQRTLPTGATMEEAIRVRETLKGRIQAARPTRPEAPITTVADYAERWLMQKAKRVKASTLRTYITAMERYILPQLGHIRLAAIVRSDLEDWVAWAEGQETEITVEDEHGERVKSLAPYSTPTVRKWWRVLATMCKDAHADRLMQEDPTMRVSPPDTGVRGRQESRTLSVRELGDLLSVVRQVYPDRYAEVATLAYTGMRAGELYALTWTDVDLSGGRVFVRRSVWNGQVGTTKTNSEREVPIPAVVADALKGRREAMLRDQHPGLEAGLVFPSDTGSHRYPSSLTKPLDAACARAGIDIRVTPQVFRRTFNTLMISAAVDRIVLRSIIGHSSEQMTERYAGVRLDEKKAAVARLVAQANGDDG